MSDSSFDDAAKAAADATGTTATGDTPPGATADAPIVPRKGPGRPKGSKSKARAPRAAGGADTREPGPTDDEPLSPEDARKSAAFLLGYVDKLVSQFGKTEPLTPEEIEQGADALGPVVAKYAGGALSPEVVAVVWVAGAYGPRVVRVIEARRRGALPQSLEIPVSDGGENRAPVVAGGE